MDYNMHFKPKKSIFITSACLHLISIREIIKNKAIISLVMDNDSTKSTSTQLQTCWSARINPDGTSKGQTFGFSEYTDTREGTPTAASSWTPEPKNSQTLNLGSSQGTFASTICPVWFSCTYAKFLGCQLQITFLGGCRSSIHAVKKAPQHIFISIYTLKSSQTSVGIWSQKRLS